MATNTEVTRRGSSAATQATQGPASQRAQSAEAPIRPPVDVWEDKNGITLCADMPGVSRDRLRDAGLIRTTKQGVENLNCVRWDDVDSRFPGLLKAIMKFQP